MGNIEVNGSCVFKELKNVRQIPGEPLRRYFTHDDIDLLVWVRKNRVFGFQLITPWRESQIAITWYDGKGLSLGEVDDGEGRPARPKMSPLLVSQDFKITTIQDIFQVISEKLPPGLATIIEKEITGCRTTVTPHTR